MNLLKNKRNFLKLFRPSLYNYSQVSLLENQLKFNGQRNCVRFESQNILWTYAEFDVQAKAVGWGFRELGYNPGDKVIMWIERAHPAEIITGILGALQVGVHIIPCTAETSEELSQLITESGAKGIFFSPNSRTEGLKYIEHVNKLFPELITYPYGKEITLEKYPNLKHIIHTGFYTYPGTFKFRQFLLYGSKNFNTLTLPEVQDDRPLIGDYSFVDLLTRTAKWRDDCEVEDHTIIVSGDSKTFNGTLGILNSLIYGNYAVYTGTSDFKKLQYLKSIHHNPYFIIEKGVHESYEDLGVATQLFDRKAEV